MSEIDVSKLITELTKMADGLHSQTRSLVGHDGTTRLAILTAHYTVAAIAEALKQATKP